MLSASGGGGIIFGCIKLNVPSAVARQYTKYVNKDNTIDLASVTDTDSLYSYIISVWKQGCYYSSELDEFYDFSNRTYDAGQLQKDESVFTDLVRKELSWSEIMSGNFNHVAELEEASTEDESFAYVTDISIDSIYDMTVDSIVNEKWTAVYLDGVRYEANDLWKDNEVVYEKYMSLTPRARLQFIQSIMFFADELLSERENREILIEVVNMISKDLCDSLNLYETLDVGKEDIDDILSRKSLFRFEYNGEDGYLPTNFISSGVGVLDSINRDKFNTSYASLIDALSSGVVLDLNSYKSYDLSGKTYDGVDGNKYSYTDMWVSGVEDTSVMPLDDIKLANLKFYSKQDLLSDIMILADAKISADKVGVDECSVTQETVDTFVDILQKQTGLDSSLLAILFSDDSSKVSTTPFILREEFNKIFNDVSTADLTEIGRQDFLTDLFMLTNLICYDFESNTKSGALSVMDNLVTMTCYQFGIVNSEDIKYVSDTVSNEFQKCLEVQR